MRRIAFVSAAAIVPAALIALLLVGYDYYDRERSRLIRDSLGTTRALAAAVDAELAGVRSALLALATSPHLDSDDLAAFHAQALAVLPGQSFINVVLIDERGRQLVNTLRRFGEPLPAQASPAEILRIFETGEPVISDLFVGPVAQRHVFAIGVPVKRGGTTRYALNAGIAPERLAKILSGQRLPADWIGAVFDKSGTIVTRTHDPEGTVGRKAPPRFIQRMKEDDEDIFEGGTVEGTRVLAVYRRAPGSGWTVAIGIPQQELVKHLVYSIGRLFVVGFIALVTALLLVVLLGRRLMRSPQ